MKKVIAAVDAVNFSAEQLLHFNQVATLVNSRLTVIFLENIISLIMPQVVPYPDGSYTYYEVMNESALQEREKIIGEKIALFHKVCQERNINAGLHEKKSVPLEELLEESIYADLLLVNNNIMLAPLIETEPPKFLRDALREAHCPVLILPDKFYEIREFIFTCNASLSSMYAIRQFASLFEMKNAARITLLYVDESGSGKLKNGNLISGYLDAHYKNWELKIIKGNPSAFIMEYLVGRNDCLVTFGAYGRSNLSQFFRHSNAEKTLHSLNRYVFVSHL